MGWGGLFWRDRGLNGVSTKEEQGLLMGGLCSAVTWGMVPLWVCLGAPGVAVSRNLSALAAAEGSLSPSSLFLFPFFTFLSPFRLAFGFAFRKV